MDNLVAGKRMYAFAKKIFPYCRSITGQGVRDTLRDIAEYIAVDGVPALTVHEVPTGTPVFDWTVPKEWVIREAYIEDELGNHIIDMKEHNLHVVGYSVPVDKWVDLEELKEHIFTQPDQPEVIPYVTSYYKERYGFCMSEELKNALSPGQYHMYIDSELIDGDLIYAEVVLPGKNAEEVFFSTYFCHPSMANNECSGPALSAELVRYVAAMKDRRYTYRFLYIPETIGSITYMATEDHLQYMRDHIVAGFNLSCVGDDRTYSIVESRYGNTLSDRVLANVLHYHTNDDYMRYSFLKRGSDERQYNAPGIDLPVVCFCRSKFGEYPEYHTSADDMSLVSPEGFQGSYDVMTQVIDALEYNYCYKASVFGEPQYGKRGLYPNLTGKTPHADEVEFMQNMVAYADGRNDVIAISDIINAPIYFLIPIVKKLLKRGLLNR